MSIHREFHSLCWFGLDVDGVIEEVVAIVFWWEEVGA